jgi:hypothetical protein
VAVSKKASPFERRVFEPYAGQHIALTTMHEKNRAIAGAIQQQLGAELVVPTGIDTDQLGTFCGEIERQGTMGEVAIAKARLGMARAGLTIGLASEGSYGPHPNIPFVSAGMELMVLVDDQRQLIVFESLIDEAPCFHQSTAAPAEDLSSFLERAMFPGHALIVEPNAPTGARRAVAKGVRDVPALKEAVALAAAASEDGLALVQTDMRAHMNPTRMATIERLARKLCGRLLVPCPACRSPGFGFIQIEKGLPCAWCTEPTLMAKGETLGCSACEMRATRPRADGLTKADPGHCPHCNP